MKFVVTAYGSRGDVEPWVAAGRELLRRGHDVHMAVAPNWLGLAEAAGLAAVTYGPDTQSLDEEHVAMFRKPPITVLPQVMEYVAQDWLQKSATLTQLADGADLLVTAGSEQELAENVAEHHDIPLASLHYCPPEAIPVRWLDRQLRDAAKSAQRTALGLPQTTAPPTESLEIQAYDELCLPGLAAEWTESGVPRRSRPFVGALTLELPTEADDEVLSWIAAGSPPIYFGFGSIPITTFAATVAMLSAACSELGERALIFTGPNEVAALPLSSHVKYVRAVNHAAVFPSCRAVVHHGGAGTTAAGLRAGIPSLILWVFLDQPLWAAAVHQLGVGTGRQFLAVTQESLVEDLSSILVPHCVNRASEVAAAMTKPAESVAAAADLLEDWAARSPSPRLRC
jgi:vancomycin aglycone glucosyltransferase